MDRILNNRHDELVEILPNIRRFAYSLCNNMADADDMLQSTVERVLERGLPDDAALLPWCLRVCRNLWIDEIRSRKVRSDNALQSAEDDEPSVHGENQAIGEIALREVDEIMQSMPDEQRAVLELVAVEGFSYKETAAALEVPVGTVMSRLARARSALADRTGHNDDPATTPGGA